MSDPFGAIAHQDIGDLGVHIGNGQWAGTGHMPADIAVLIHGPQSAIATDISIPFPNTTGRRLDIIDGSSTNPVTESNPTVFISRYATTPATDYGGLTINEIATASSVGQATPFQVFVKQNASVDALAAGVQTVMENVGGAGFGLFSNTSNSAITCTITNASPAVVTVTGHGLAADHEVVFNAVGGTLPAGMTAGTRYFVLAAGLTANSFRFAASPGGSAINTSSAGSGTFYVNGTSIWGYNPVLINNSKVPMVWNGSSVNAMTGVLVQAFNANSGASGNALRVIDTGVGAGTQLSEGLVFEANTIANQTFIDASSSGTVFSIQGSHTVLMDVSAATITTGWHGALTVDNAVTVTRATSNNMYNLVGTGTGATSWGLTVLTTGAFNLNEIGVNFSLSVTKGTPGANKTNLYVLEGATPTLRQFTTFDPGAAGVNFTAGQLVAVLV